MGKKRVKLAILGVAIALLVAVAVPILASSSGGHAAPPEGKGKPSEWPPPVGTVWEYNVHYDDGAGHEDDCVARDTVVEDMEAEDGGVGVLHQVLDCHPTYDPPVTGDPQTPLRYGGSAGQVWLSIDQYLRLDTGRVEQIQLHLWATGVGYLTNLLFWTHAADPLPGLAVGHTWRDDLDVVGGPVPSLHLSRQRAVVAEESVPVPAGTFNCYKVESWDLSTGQLSEEQWISPDVGMVKYIIYSFDGVETRVLLSYTPGS